MKYSISFLLFLTLVANVFSQGYLPTSKSIEQFNLKKGVYEANIKLANNTFWEIMISVPEIQDGEELDLVLALHWGVGASNYDEFMKCLILPAFDQKKYIIVAPFAQRQAWWVDPKKEQLIKLVELIKQHWPVKNSIVSGYSDGGTGSVYFANKHPDLFDAAIALAGSYSPIKKFKIPTYIIHGTGDQLFDYERTKEIMESAKKNSPDMVFKTTTELTHFEGCAYVGLLKEGIAWVEDKLQ